MASPGSDGSRAFVIAPTDALVSAIRGALAHGFVVDGSTDPRRIKAFAAEGPIAAVLVTENVERPTATELARALRPALGDAVFVLVTRGVRVLEPDDGFDVGVSFPVAERVLVSNVRRAIRAAHASRFDPRAMQAEIELRSLGLERKSHYEILDVPPGAGADEVTRAYDALSLKFHPDRLRRLDDASREAGMQLYLRIGEAYRTLRSREARMRYDTTLEAGGDPASAAGPVATLETFEEWSKVPAARKQLAVAQRALIGKDVKLALVHLRFARTLDPDNALIARKLEELDPQTPAPSSAPEGGDG